MINICLVILAVSFLIILRVFLLTKDLNTKLLMLNSLTAQVISVIVIIGFFLNQPIFIDIAILYALTSFIANAVFLRIRKGN